MHAVAFPGATAVGAAVEGYVTFECSLCEASYGYINVVHGCLKDLQRSSSERCLCKPDVLREQSVGPDLSAYSLDNTFWG